jgi:hypothetical protein
MGVSDEAKHVIPLKFLRKIKKKKFPSCKLSPGTYYIQGAPKMAYKLLTTLSRMLKCEKNMENMFPTKKSIIFLLLLTIIQCKERYIHTSLPCNVTVEDLK